MATMYTSPAVTSIRQLANTARMSASFQGAVRWLSRARGAPCSGDQPAAAELGQKQHILRQDDPRGPTADVDPLDRASRRQVLSQHCSGTGQAGLLLDGMHRLRSYQSTRSRTLPGGQGGLEAPRRDRDR